MHIAANMEGMGLYLAWPTLSKAGPKQTPGHIPGWAGHVVLRHPYVFFLVNGTNTSTVNHRCLSSKMGGAF